MLSEKPHFKRVYLTIGGVYAWAVFAHRRASRPVIICVQLSRAQEMARERLGPKNFRNQEVSTRLRGA